MNEDITLQSIQRQFLQPRPSTRTDGRPKNYSSFAINGIAAQRAKTAKKLDPVLRMSANNRNSVQEKKEYLYIKLMRKKQAYTPQLQYTKLQEKTKPQDNANQPQCFIRTRKAKGKLTSRTDLLANHEKQTRPGTSQSSYSSEKLAYFDGLCSERENLKHYKIMSHIGKGAFSVVSLAIGKENHTNYAIKTYEKLEALDWNRLACIKREIKHLKNLDHARVIKLADVIKQRKKLYLVLENGGSHSLCGFLRKQKVFSEVKCKGFMKQILEGISYCHENGVCHRDLKPENILIDSNGDVKIIDFGFSAHSKMMLTTYCGTPAYMSPQIIKKQPYNGSKADIWALGVMLYLMGVGTLPFRAPNQQELNRLILTGKYRYRDQNAVSSQFKKIVAKMLQVNSETRLSAKQLLSENWFN